jgi:hypothetical protein
MDSILKLVYPDWCQHPSGYKDPIPNGLHPVLVRHIQATVSEGKTLVEAQQLIQAQNSTQVFVHNHNNLLGYHKRYYPESTLVGVDGIIDDDSIYLYPVEVRTTLNSLFSTLNFVLDEQQHEYMFADIIPTAILAHLRTGKVKLLINYVHEPMAPVDQINFTNVEDKMSELGVDGSDIIVVGGNKFSHPTSKIKFTDGGILMGQQMAADMDSFPRKTALGYYSDFARESDLDQSKVRSKKFLCFNRTMKPHRFMIAYLALKHKLLDNSIFSFINPNGMTAHSIHHQLRHYYGLASDPELEEISSTIFNLIPYEIDTQHLSVTEKQSFGNENSKKELYLDTYLHLTSETRFDSGDYPFFSEKTYRPLINLQPFIFIGNHHSLEKLHKMGFKTFHPFINEDYDLEEDPKKRMAMIEKEIETFNSKPVEEIHRWYYSITDILLHNQCQVQTLKNVNPYKEVYFDIRKTYE